MFISYQIHPLLIPLSLHNPLSHSMGSLLQGQDVSGAVAEDYHDNDKNGIHYVQVVF